MEERINKVIKAISAIIPKDFSDCNDLKDFCPTAEANGLSSCHLATGATKLAIIPKEEDFVIKVPFEYRYDEFSDEFVPFEYAYNSENNGDYCFSEYEAYLAAVDYGVGCFFPKTEIATIGISGAILIQEKCKPLNQTDVSIIKNYSQDSMSKAWNIYDTAGFSIHMGWMAKCVEVYGEELFKKLITFLEENEYGQRAADDLHTGNIGYDKEGKPIILDFSGYNEE